MPPLSDGQIARSLQKRLAQSLSTPQGPFFWAGWQDGATGQVGRVRDTSGRFYTGIVRGNEQPRDGAAVKYIPGNVPIIVVQDIPEVPPQVGGGEPPVTVAVLYFVINGAIKEYWVKTAADDVKVAEISPSGIQIYRTIASYEFDTVQYSPGVTVTGSISGSLSITPLGGVSNPIYDDSNIGDTSISESYSFTSSFASSDYFESGLDEGYIITNQSLQITGSLSASQSEPNVESGEGQNETNGQIVVGPETVSVRAETSGQGDGITENDSDSIDITLSPNGNTNSLAYLSVVDGTPWVIIKGNELDVVTSNVVGRDYSILIYGPYTSPTEYSSTAPLPNPNDWRAPLINFNELPGTSSDPCVTANITEDDVLLQNDIRYRIDLSQTVSIPGLPTLRAALQNQPGTISAQLREQPATDVGGTCSLGSTTVTTIEIPSPGRGTVEGIVYIPSA